MLVIAIVVVLAIIYGVAYGLNQNIAKPAGCENLLQECHCCTISSCGHHPTDKESC